ncbi:MAG: pitrilysin family protein [Polyangiales bacterium]
MATASGVSLPELPCAAMALDCGLRVRLIPLPHLQSATVSCFVRVGSRYESETTNGLSHFLEHMLYRGTEGHPDAHELSLAIERLGGTLEAATHVDFSSYDLTLPPEAIAEGASLLAEVLRRPLLTEFGTEKEIIREEILEELNESGEQIDIDNVSRRMLYPNHSLGFTIAGPIANLERFDTRALKHHHDTHYTARNAVLCVAGAFDEESLASVIREGFEDLPGGTPLSANGDVMAGRDGRFTVVHEPGSQTEVRLSFHTPGVRDIAAPAFLLLDRILDDGLSTRVHRVICEEKGLAYEAFSGMDSFEDCGVYEFGASVEHGKVPALVETTLDLIRDLQDRPPSADELEKAKRRYLWDMRTIRDDSEDTSHFVGTSALFSLPEQLGAAAEQVSAVSADQIQSLAQRFLRPEDAYLTCVGILDNEVRAGLERLITRG